MLPLLPIMYLQGKRIKASVPTLPEAEGIEGITGAGEKSNLKVIFIGESTIAGVGVRTHEEGFSGTLANSLATKLNSPIAWKVYARSGYTAKRVSEKIVPKITENTVDLIVIGLGGNDAFTLNSPNKWNLHIQELINTLQTKFGKQTPIVFTNMPPIKEFPAFTPLIKFCVGNLVELLGQEVSKVITNYQNVYYHAEVITMENWIGKLQLDAKVSDFFSDGVHPAKFAYQTWAKDMVEFILDNQELRQYLQGKIRY